MAGSACSPNGYWDQSQYTSNTSGSNYCLVQWWWEADLSEVKGTGATCGAGTFTRSRPSEISGLRFVECYHWSGGASYVQCRVRET
jgi:hypothetical protein